MRFTAGLLLCIFLALRLQTGTALPASHTAQTTTSCRTCSAQPPLHQPTLRACSAHHYACAGAGEAAAGAHLGPQDPSLDRFFAKHTGEDNAAYQEIAEASRKRKRDAKAWLFEDKGPQRGPLALEAPPTGSSGSTAATGEGLPRLEASGQAQQLQGQRRPFTGASQSQQLAALPAAPAAGSDQPAESEMSAGPSQAQEGPPGVAVAFQGEAGLEPPLQRAMVPNPGRPPVSTDDFGTGGQTDQTLTSWPYVNKNALYYDSSQRDAVPLTDSEKAALVQGPPKQIK